MVPLSRREFLAVGCTTKRKSDVPCRYFLSQNEGISNGTVSGIPINLKFLGVGDGLTVRHTQRKRLQRWMLTGFIM